MNQGAASFHVDTSGSDATPMENEDDRSSQMDAEKSLKRKSPDCVGYDEVNHLSLSMVSGEPTSQDDPPTHFSGP